MEEPLNPEGACYSGRSHSNQSQPPTETNKAGDTSKEPLDLRSSAVITEEAEDLSRLRNLPYLQYSHSLTRFSSNTFDNSSMDLENLKREYLPFQEKICQLVDLSAYRAASLKKEDMLQAAVGNFQKVLSCQVCFLKKVTGFSNMNMDDEVTIAKHAPFKNLLLLTAYTYDLDTNCYTFFLFRSDTNQFVWLLEVFPYSTAITNHFASFGKLVKSLNLQTEEYALLTALNSFCPCFISEIKDQGYFLTIHNKYMSLLAFYTKENYRDSAERMAQLVSVLAACDDARRLHEESASRFTQIS